MKRGRPVHMERPSDCSLAAAVTPHIQTSVDIAGGNQSPCLEQGTADRVAGTVIGPGCYPLYSRLYDEVIVQFLNSGLHVADVLTHLYDLQAACRGIFNDSTQAMAIGSGTGVRPPPTTWRGRTPALWY